MSERVRLHRSKDGAARSHAPRPQTASRSAETPPKTADARFGHSFAALAARPLQAKLSVTQPGDAFEQEAEAAANRVMKMAAPEGAEMSDVRVGSQNGTAARQLARQAVPEEEEEEATHASAPQVARAPKPEEEEEEEASNASAPQVARAPLPGEEEEEEEPRAAAGPAAAQRACAECEEEERVGRKESDDIEGGADVSPIVEHGVSSGGQPLDAETRGFMEPRFGHDFSQVRVHTDTRASRSADAVAARAYTVGSDVVFGKGEYNPGTSNGKQLLAHELAHVVQQSGGSAMRSVENAELRRQAQVNRPNPSPKTLMDGALQRVPKVIAARNWGRGSDLRMHGLGKVTLKGGGAGSSIAWFNSSDTEKITLKCPSNGTLQIEQFIEWNYYYEEPGMLVGTNKKEKHGRFTAVTAPDFEVDAEGKLTIKQPGFTVTGDIAPDVLTNTHTPTLSKTDDYNSDLRFQSDVAAAASTQFTKGATLGGETSAGGKAGVPLVAEGEVSVKASAGTSRGVAFTSSGAAKWSDVYTIQLSVPMTEKKPAPIESSILFGTNSPKPTPAGAHEIQLWFQKLTPEVKKSIETGKVRIELTGRADTRGSFAYNQTLATKRSAEVLRLLTSEVAPWLKADQFRPENPGKPEGKEADIPALRSVTLRVTPEGGKLCEPSAPAKP